MSAPANSTTSASSLATNLVTTAISASVDVPTETRGKLGSGLDHLVVRAPTPIVTPAPQTVFAATPAATRVAASALASGAACATATALPHSAHNGVASVVVGAPALQPAILARTFPAILPFLSARDRGHFAVAMGPASSAARATTSSATAAAVAAIASRPARIPLSMQLVAHRNQMRANRRVTVEDLRTEALLVANINIQIETRNEGIRRENHLRIQRQQAPLALQPLEGYPVMDEIEEVDLSGTVPYRGILLLRELERFPCRRALSLSRSTTDDDLNVVALHEERRQATHLANLLAHVQIAGEPGVYDLADRCRRDPVSGRSALLDYCRQSVNHTLQTLAERCRSLRSLNLINCQSISDNEPRPSISDEGIERLLHVCPDLIRLNVAYCAQLTDASINAAATHCRDLQSLDARNCPQLTDAGISAIAANCRGLQSLDVYRCRRLTDASMSALAAGCPGLQSLDVGNCDQLTDASINQVAVNCPGLRGLEVEGCALLTDTSISNLATRCRGLQRLKVGGCVLLTDASITNLATHCRDLQHVDIYDCHLLTNTSISTLTTNCHGLQRLNAINCGQLTYADQEAIRTAHPNLIFYC